MSFIIIKNRDYFYRHVQYRLQVILYMIREYFSVSPTLNNFHMFTHQTRKDGKEPEKKFKIL